MSVKNILKNYSDHHHKLIFEQDDLAYNYLKKRGVSKETILEFQIGFVPSNSEYYLSLIHI